MRSPLLGPAFLCLSLQGALGVPEGVGIPLVREGRPAATLVILGSSPPHPLIPSLLQDELQALLGVRLPEGDLSGAGPAVLVADADALPEGIRTRLPLDGIRHDGFLIETLEVSGRQVLVVSGKVPRGTYNGTAYLKDLYFRPASDRELVLEPIHLLRNTKVPIRLAHTAEEWGDAAYFPLERWEWAIDEISQWGYTHWVPCPVGLVDTLRGKPLRKIYPGATLDAAAYRRLGQYSHARGLGVASVDCTFFWMDADVLANAFEAELPSIRSVGRRGGMCPSDPAARALMKEHALACLAAFPEIDMFWCDPGDEEGECRCEQCRKPLDTLGSHQYGASLVSFYRELAEEIWRRRPEVRFGLSVGFEHFHFPGQVPAHTGDAKYYQALKHWEDPRLYLLHNYRAWTVVGKDGTQVPFERLTPRGLHTLWPESSPHHRKLWEVISARGLAGGFDWAEPPVDRSDLSWRFYHFESREATWASSAPEETDALWDRYLWGPEVPAEAAMAMRQLLQWSLDARAIKTSQGVLFSRPYRERAIARGVLAQLKAEGPFDPAEVRRWKAYLGKIGQVGEERLIPWIRKIEEGVAAVKEKRTPRTSTSLDRWIRPWLEEFKQDYLLTPELRKELAASMRKLEALAPDRGFAQSRRGGWRRWETFAGAKDPGAEGVRKAEPSAWEPAEVAAYPDQVALHKLEEGKGLSGYARARISLDQEAEAGLALGLYPSNFGDRIACEIWVNGERVGGLDEVFGGFVSPGERGFVYVPKVPFDMGDIQIAYLTCGIYPARLRKGENEILVRLHHEGWVPEGKDPARHLSLGFDLRILNAAGKPLPVR